jgi:hypothetical protein
VMICADPRLRLDRIGQVEGLFQGIAGGEDVAGVTREGKPFVEELNLPRRDGADDLSNGHASQGELSPGVRVGH